MPDSDSPQLGRLALERGLVTEEQLAEALAELERRRAAGSQLPLGELLVAMGLVTRHQLKSLLEAHVGHRPPAQQIEGYELIRKIGEGGMGAVYLARQTSLDRMVAIKVLRRQYSRDPAYVDRFLREARLAGKLDHINLIRAIDVGESGGYHYLAMDYVEGRTLSELMPPGEKLAEDFSLNVILQVARGLEHAHRHGIVHRDIKPDNILIDAKGVAKLADLGLAKQLNASTRLTQTGMVFGTADYMSPEQARGEGTTDTRGDIYSVGATLFHLVTGRPPFEGPNALAVLNKHIGESPPWAADVNPAVSPGCSQLIARMMAKDPADRHQDPPELIADLERVIAGQSPAKAMPHAGDKPHPPRATPEAREQPPAHVRRPARPVKGGTTDDTRPVSPAARRRALGAPLLAAAAAVLLLLGLGIGLAARGPGRDTDARQEERLRSLYAEAEALRKAGSFEAAIAKFELLRDEGRGTAWEVLAGKSLEEIRALREKKLAPLTGARPETDAKLRAMYEQAGQFRKEHPDDYAGALERFGQIREQAAGTQWTGLAAEAMTEVEAARDRAADALVAPLRQRAEALAAAGDFDGAIAALVGAQHAAPLQEIMVPRCQAAADDIRKQADEKLGAALAAAERCSKDGRPADGLAELDKLSGLKCAAWAAKLAAMRARLEKDQADGKATAERRLRAEALRALAAILDGFEERALAGDQAGAAGFLAAERTRLKPEHLDIVSADLAGAERVATRLKAEAARRGAELGKLPGRTVELLLKDGGRVSGKVLAASDAGIRIEVIRREGPAEIAQPRLVTFGELALGEADRLVPRSRSEGPDGQVAEAMLLMASGSGGPASPELRRAGEALAAAGAHPLVASLTKRLDYLKTDPRERAAGQAWEDSVAKLVRPKYSAEEAKALLAAIEAFQRDHGATDFAKARSAAMTKLRLAAGDETEKLRVLFGGQVVRYDPLKLEIELLWDFSSPAQLAGFTVLGGKAEVRDGQLVLEAETIVACRATFEPRLRATWDWETLQGAQAGARFTAGTEAVTLLQADGLAFVLRGLKQVVGEVPMRRSGQSAALSDGQLVAEVDGKAIGKPLAMPAGQSRFEIYSARATSRFDNIRLTGTLNRAWLTAALARLSASEGPGNPRGGSWQLKPATR
jgi:predicted Ser/Thr protein kinase